METIPLPVSIAGKKASAKATSDLRLTISFILKRDALWAKAGHEVAWEQFCIQEGALLSSKLENRGRLKVRADEEHLSISGSGFSIQWEKTIILVPFPDDIMERNEAVGLLRYAT